MRTKDLWIMFGALLLAVLVGGRRIFSGKFWNLAKTPGLPKMKLPLDVLK
jgi:hypothetical protein